MAKNRKKIEKEKKAKEQKKDFKKQKKNNTEETEDKIEDKQEKEEQKEEDSYDKDGDGNLKIKDKNDSNKTKKINKKAKDDNGNESIIDEDGDIVMDEEDKKNFKIKKETKISKKHNKKVKVDLDNEDAIDENDAKISYDDIKKVKREKKSKVPKKVDKDIKKIKDNKIKAKKPKKKDEDDEADEKDSYDEYSKDSKDQDKNKDSGAKIQTVIAKSGIAVDINVPNSQNYHVVLDTNNDFNGKYFAATLNESNLDRNNNKFYILQIIQEDTTGNIFFFTRWGRIGSKGAQSMEPMLNLSQAIKKFKSKYRAKTGKHYQEIIIEYENEKEDKKEEEEKKEEKEKENNNPPKSKPLLDKYISQFISLIFNMNVMNTQMTEIGYDVKKMPLGKLGKVTLDQGYEVLKKIEKVIEEGNGTSLLSELSSQFYTLIPHNFGYQKMKNFIIDNLEKLKEKIDMIEALRNLTVTTKIISEDKDSDIKNDENKLLYSYYQKLHCKMRHIESSESIYPILKKYLQAKSSKLYYSNIQMIEAFEIEREGEKERFNDKLGNKMLLWHGSRITNFVGILSQGLRIAPPEAPSSGYLFGKGLYFANMSAKSAGYCYPNNGIGHILLAEVALGRIDKRTDTDYRLPSSLSKDCQSAQGIGRCTPSGGIFIEKNIFVPYDDAMYKNDAYMEFDEFIVYNVNQARLRYLIKFKCDGY